MSQPPNHSTPGHLAPQNPYVGLRPFEEADSEFFFGRTEQVSELLDRLHRQRFLAVVGVSGSGKSSLVKAGLLPLLRAGYLVEDRQEWRLAHLTPGQQPLQHLMEAMEEAFRHLPQAPSAQHLTEEAEALGVAGILEALAPLFKAQPTNLLILIDQFEELFRFAPARQGGGETRQDNEAQEFVQLLLGLARAAGQPIYVIITMRSDFIGDCARFYQLPEALNTGQYLVPRLTRAQRKQAITAPARLAGTQLHARLTDRLLNDTQGFDDQLPLLQHALMRMWNAAQEGEATTSDSNTTLSLNHQKETGGVEGALSKHLDELQQAQPPKTSSLPCASFRRLPPKTSRAAASASLPA